MQRLLTDFFKPISTANSNTDASPSKRKITLPYPMSDDDEDISYQFKRKRKSEDTERRKNIKMNNTQGELIDSNNKIQILSNVAIPRNAVEEGGNSKMKESAASSSSAFVADNGKLTTQIGKSINMENYSKPDQGIQVMVTTGKLSLTMNIEEKNETSHASYSTTHCKNNSPKILDSYISSSPSTSKAGYPLLINSSESSSKFEDKKEKQSHNEMKFLKKTFEDTFQDTAKKNLFTSNEIRLIQKFFDMTEKNQYFLLKLFTLHMWHNIRDFCTEIELDSLEILKEHLSQRYDEFVEQDITSLSIYEMLSILSSKKLYKVQTDLGPEGKFKKKSKIMPFLIEKYEEDKLRQAAKKRLGECIKMKDDVWSTFYKAFILQCYCNPSYYMAIQNYLKDMTDKVYYPEMACQNYLPFKRRREFLRFFEAVLMNIKLNRELKNINGREEQKRLEIVKNICDEAYQKLKDCDAYGRMRKGDETIFLQQFSAEYVYINILHTNIETLRTKYQATVVNWLEYLTTKYPNNRHVGLWYKELAEIKMNHLKKYTDAGEHLLKVYEIIKKYDVFDSLQLIELNQMCKKMITTESYELWPSLRDQLTRYFVKFGGSIKVTVKYIDVDANESLTSKRKRWTDNHDMESETLEHYKKEGYEGLYCQETFFAALFVLFFWDVIYEFYVPKAIISKVQTAPLDIYSKDFYKCRYNEVKQRLESIATGWSREHLEETFKKNCNDHSHEKSFVDFEILQTHSEEIKKIVRYIDRKVLSEILRVFARNSGKCRIGLPKLFLWNAESQYKFVAVENQKKKFDHNELLWLEFLSRVGANVEVSRRSDINPEMKSRKKFKNDSE